ncbi:MAG: precorrin-8X methylmutase [Methanomassiliicoccaceae archaeon]|jgi:precorrin-8X/cobalt-precorrin-8 methylmutase|nr:precorrin-8X methylmutase [Methanomassiliicoccaceae archaeon]
MEKMEFSRPEEIEKRSMDIIESELNGRRWPEPVFSIIKRCIHTSADLDYADNLIFSEGAALKGIAALRKGAHIITDTNMVLSGINKKVLREYGGDAHCFIADPDVVREAKERGCTRAMVAMERGADLDREIIYAVGNAPTALFSIYDLMKSGKVSPKLVIAAPVGFVNIIESKDLIMSTDVPHIVAYGRKGGSNIAAAICNAMLYSGIDI